MNEGMLENETGSTTTLSREQTSLIGQRHSHDVWKEVMDLYDLESCE